MIVVPLIDPTGKFMFIRFTRGSVRVEVTAMRERDYQVGSLAKSALHRSGHS
jgi:hypothetical protein